MHDQGSFATPRAARRLPPPRHCCRVAARPWTAGRWAAVSAAGLLGVAGAAPAQAAPAKASPPTSAPARDHAITIEDYFTIAQPLQVAVAPHGQTIAWTELRWQDDLPARNGDLWLHDRKTGATRRLTFHTAMDMDPRFGPDGTSLYFVSTRSDPRTPSLAKGGKQVWRIGAGGDDLRPVTSHDGGIDGWQLQADGKALWYTVTRDHQDDDGFAALRKAHKAKYSKGERKWSTLRRLDLASWRDEKVANIKGYVRAFAIDPAATRALLITIPSDRLIDNEGWSRAELLDLGPGGEPDAPRLHPIDDARWRKEAPSPYGWLEHPVWSDDGAVAAFSVGFDGFPAEVIAVEVVELRATSVRRVPRFEEYAFEGPLAFRPGTRELCGRGTLRAVDGVFCAVIAAAGAASAGRRLTNEQVGVIGAFAFARDGSLAVTASTVTTMPEVMVLDAAGGRPQRISHINPHVDQWKIPTVQRYRWKSPDGTEVEGILELPPGYDRSKGPLPLVVELHGGPTSATKLELRYWIYGRTLFAARGWALLSPNYRGSTGYGDKFLTELVGHENDRDVQDILSGVNALVAEGVVDPKRMAVMGWSNGGYLTNCVIAADPRFAAASSGAGVVDQTMQWATEDTPGHVINYMRGLPWKQPAEVVRASPLYQADKIRTPTLIHFGEGDERVPVQHGLALFRALDQYQQVPTQLVVYPGEGHGLTKRAHREAKLRWDVAWFERYVPGFAAAAKK